MKISQEDAKIQGEVHKALQSDSTQTIDHIQKCFRQKFQCSRRPPYWTTLFCYRWRRWSYVNVNSTFSNGRIFFFSMTLLSILRRIQRLTTQGHSSYAKYENSRKIETYRNNHFQRIYYPWFESTYRRCSKWWPLTCKHLLIRWWKGRQKPRISSINIIRTLLRLWNDSEIVYRISLCSYEHRNHTKSRSSKWDHYTRNDQ